MKRLRIALAGVTAAATVSVGAAATPQLAGAYDPDCGKWAEPTRTDGWKEIHGTCWNAQVGDKKFRIVAELYAKATGEFWTKYGGFEDCDGRPSSVGFDLDRNEWISWRVAVFDDNIDRGC